MGNTQIDHEMTDSSLWQGSFIPRVVLKYPIEFKNGAKIVPMIGGGAGATIVGLDLNGLEIISDGYYIPWRSMDVESVFTYQLFGGLRYEFNEHASVGLQYRFSRLDKIEHMRPDSWLSTGDHTLLDKLTTHTISAAFTWRF